jgi:hypothetical protein
MNTNIAWNLLRGLTLAMASVVAGCSGHDASPVDGTGSSSGSSGASSSSGGSSSGGSSGSGTGAALFDAPTGAATPDSIYGVWAGTIKGTGVTFDTRMKLSAASATLATRCTLASGSSSAVVGVTVAARISADGFVILESKSDKKDDGTVKCAVNVTPKQIKPCSAEDKGFEHDCFALEGTTFTDYGATSFDKSEFTKLSD